MLINVICIKMFITEELIATSKRFIQRLVCVFQNELYEMYGF